MDNTHGLNTMEQRLMARAGVMGIPISGALELLPLCNMNCDMCYVRLSRGEMEKQGRLRTGAEWLALGRQMARSGTLFLQLTGGEPLLHPDFKEIYLGLKKLGMVLTLNTNGTLIDEAWADFFAVNKPRRINITLYGADSGTYERLCHYREGFDRTIRAVKLLRARNVDVKLSCSLTRENAPELSAMAQIARELEVPLHVDPYMMPAERERGMPFDMQSRMEPEAAAAAALEFQRNTKTAEAFAAYRAEMLGRVDAFVPREAQPSVPGCLAGRCGFTVSWLGRLQPCEVLTDPAVDVFDTGFQAGWDQIRQKNAQIRFCADCAACRLRPLCSVCHAACRLETGADMGKPEYLCRYAAESERLLRLTLEEDHE